MTGTTDQDTPNGYSLADRLQTLFAKADVTMVEKLAACDPGIGARDQDGDRAVADVAAPESSPEPPEVLQVIEPPVSLADGRGYGDAAPLYRAAGWPGVLPLPPRSKVTPPPGYSGYEGDWPNDEMIAQWREMYPYDANLCLRLPDTVIGLDVDAYEGKTGGQTLAEAERRWGPLPDAPTSTSRDDGVSGIRHFRVPAGTVLRDEIKFGELGLSHIEIVQRHYRYSVAWPSVHPTTGHRYVWRLGDETIARPPSPEDLPELPQTWLDALKIDLAEARRRSSSGAPLYDVTDAMTGGQPSDKVAQRLGAALYDVEHGGSRHDAMRGHVLALLRYGSRDETGVEFAVAKLYERFVDLVGPDRKGGYPEAEKEFVKMVASADRLLGDDEPEPVDPFGTKARRRAADAEHEQDRDHGNGSGAHTHLCDRLLTLSQLRTLPPVQPLVAGLVYRDTLAQLSGPPGVYKSFFCTALACAVAAGEPFGSNVVPSAGTVVYVAAEGVNNMFVRIMAWCQEWGVDHERVAERLHVLPLPIQLGNTMDVTEAIELVRELDADLLVLDTRARCTVGLDENNATAQGEAIEAAEQIRAAARCTVFGVHHSSRNGAAGRGSNAWDGAVWSDLRLERKEPLRATVKCEKHKDVPSGCEHHFSLVRYTVSADLMPGALSPEQRETLVLSRAGIGAGIASLTANSHKVILEIIRNCASREGLTGPQIAEFARERNISKSSAYAAVAALLKAGLIHDVGTKNTSRYVAVVDA